MFHLSLRIFGVSMALIFGIAILVAATSAISPVLGVLMALVTFAGGGILAAWMFLRYAVAVPVAVLEDSLASDSIARSIDLTHGNLWRVLVLFVFTFLVTIAVTMVFQVPFVIAAEVAGPETITGFWFNMIGVFTGSIASGITAPLAVVAMAVLYYDLRVRKEGLDVQLLLAGLRSAPAPTSAVSSSAILPG